MSRLLTRKETAKWLRITPATLDKLRAAKALPSIRVGAKIMFDEQKVVAFLAQGGTVRNHE